MAASGWKLCPSCNCEYHEVVSEAAGVVGCCAACGREARNIFLAMREQEKLVARDSAYLELLDAFTRYKEDGSEDSFRRAMRSALLNLCNTVSTKLLP